MNINKRLLTISRRRIIAFIIFVLAFVLTEIGRDIYRPYIYANDINDFGIANTIGNLLGAITIMFLTIAVGNSDYREGLLVIAIVTIGLILYEFSQPLLAGSTFDFEDIIATLFGGIISLAVHRMLPRGIESSSISSP
jgi:hypothetical protein